MKSLFKYTIKVNSEKSSIPKGSVFTKEIMVVFLILDILFVLFNI